MSPFSTLEPGAIAEAVLASSFTAIDPKGDLALAPLMHDMQSRSEAYNSECARRGVKFLPKQVMRPVFSKAGLADGPTIKLRASGPHFLVIGH